MKPRQICFRAAACLLPLSLILICVVTPIVLPAQDDPVDTAVEPATSQQPAAEPGEPGVVRISDVAKLPAELIEESAKELPEELANELPKELTETPALIPLTATESAIESVGIELVFDEDAGSVTLSDLWHEHSVEFLSRNREQSESLANWMFDRMGLYTPAVVHTAPIGTYNMIYPVNPDYIDPRDLRVYGAQGAGVPIVVPLAPTVRSGYNYGSGLPASRLTPISVPR